ncbi:MAG: dephospho-CoA kinase [Candidatus Hydrogenedentota bacterium]
MKVYALTGGIAAGKSEAARRFEAWGIPVIDADRVAHEIIAPDGAAEAAVIEAFGPSVLADGKIDREKLGALVFGNHARLDTLNEIVHPEVRAEIGRRLAALLEKGTRASIVDAALHAENGEMPLGMEGLILVLSPNDLRIERMMQLRGMTREDAELRIRSQRDPAEKARLARWILQNTGSIEDLHTQVDRVASEL